jgi:uncharacterized FlaG/YvyC family protein
MGHLAWLIENYRENHGKYPMSLSVLKSESEPDIQNIINEILESSNRSNLTFEYQPQTNGFVITIKGIDSWRPKENALRKEYKIGEALK